MSSQLILHIGSGISSPRPSRLGGAPRPLWAPPPWGSGAQTPRRLLSASLRRFQLPNLDSGGTQWAVWGVRVEKPTRPVLRRAVWRTRVSPGHKRLGEQSAPECLLTLTGGPGPWRLRAGLCPLFLSSSHELIISALRVMWSLLQLLNSAVVALK